MILFGCNLGIGKYSTGNCGLCWKVLGFLSITACQNSCVHALSASQKPLLSVTGCCGPSSPSRPASSSGEPIKNVPGSIQRKRWTRFAHGQISKSIANLPYLSFKPPGPLVKKRASIDLLRVGNPKQ